REREVLSREAEALLRPRRLDDLDTFFEHLAVAAVGLAAHLVVAARHRRTEGLRLARDGAPADTEHQAAAGEDVRHGEVLGEAERVPLRDDVEELAEPQAP